MLQSDAKIRQLPLTVDLGAKRLIDQLSESGKAVFEHGFDQLDQALQGRNGSNSFFIPGFHFPEKAHVHQMIFELHPDAYKNKKVIVTIKFNSGVQWRRGSLRIPNTELPESAKAYAKGMALGDLVEGAPFTDFIIRNIVYDKSVNGQKMRIMCSGDQQVEARP